MTASKLDQLRALREARISSRGSGESRVDPPKTVKVQDKSGIVETRPVERKQGDSSLAIDLQAGVASSPRETSRKGRPRIESRDKTLKATKPWLKLGMSERTWYRRQKEKKGG